MSSEDGNNNENTGLGLAYMTSGLEVTHSKGTEARQNLAHVVKSQATSKNTSEQRLEHILKLITLTAMKSPKFEKKFMLQYFLRSQYNTIQHRLHSVTNLSHGILRHTSRHGNIETRSACTARDYLAPCSGGGGSEEEGVL